MKDMTNEHRAPWDCVFAKEDDNRCHPGAPPGSDQEYFEILCLCILQAGLNWGSVRKHWPRYRRGFLDFDIGRLSRAEAKDLLASPDAIRNVKKVEALIHNAREFRAIGR